jgi:modulator of FtsH protease HflK
MAALALLGLAIAVWLASGFYQVDPAERGVVQRFGRYVSIDQPGHGWHWPWPIETMKKLNVANIRSSDSKALMLTADQSLISVTSAVQYRINDPVRFAFQVRDPELILKQTAETVMRSLVAQYALPALLNGEARSNVTVEARRRIQQAIDAYQAGIVVTSVNMTDLQLPDAVLASERDAEKADEDRRRVLAEAQAYYNEIVPKAQATAQKQVADAQVYASQTLSSAEGEAERFTQLANAYAQAPEVTRNRIYTETMETILSRSRKIIVDAKSSGGNLLYIPLDKLAEAVRAAASGSVSGPTSGAASPAGSGAASANAGSDRGEQDDRSRERTDR